MTAADDALVARLYQAVVEPEGWRAAMRGLADAVHADTFNIIAWDLNASAPRFHICERDLFGKQLDLYETNYGAIDPRRQLVGSLAEGELMVCNRHFDARFVSRSEFYQDFLVPGGMRYVLGSCLVKTADIEVTMGLHRAIGRPEYGDDELRRIGTLMPHLRRAAAMHVESQALRERVALAEAAAELGELAVMVVERGGRLRHANAKAEAQLRSGPLTLRAGRLRLDDPSENTALQRAIDSAVKDGKTTSLRAGTPPCLLTVTPAPAHAAPGCVFLLAGRHGWQRTPTVEQLMQSFALGAAEARLARALASGTKALDYARDNGVTAATVRTQIRRIYEKTGTTGLTELTRLLDTLPAVRELRRP